MMYDKADGSMAVIDAPTLCTSKVSNFIATSDTDALFSQQFIAATKYLSHDTFKRFVVRAIGGQRCQYQLGHLLDMPNISSSFLQQGGQKHTHNSLNILLLTHIKNLLQKPEDVFGILSFLLVEQLQYWITISLHHVEEILRIVFVYLTDHCDTLMTLSPVSALNEVVNLM